MKKRENWPEAMNNYVKAVWGKAFDWGAFDCCMFAANCVIEMTGEDFLAEFRGQYTDAETAYRRLLEYSGSGILGMMEIHTQKHGWEMVAPLRAQRGDIVLLPSALCDCDERFDGALGICVGTLSLFVGLSGLKAVSTIPTPGTDGITHVWRIKLQRD